MMKEKILLAPGVNGTELLRTLAKNGKNTLGLRVMNGVQLAQEALVRSGIAVPQSFLTRREEPAVYDSFIREIPYFASASFADAQQLANAVFQVRSLCPEEEAAFDKLATEGEFTAKNDALQEAYRRYIRELDQSDLIDSIGLVRKALQEAGPMDCGFLCFKEFPLSPLEKALFNRLSEGAGTETDLIRLSEKEPKPVKIESYTKAYGAVNEVEHILDEILSKEIPLDQCTVAVTESSLYAKLFYDYSAQYGIPMSFGTGLPILLTNPGKLLKLVYHWDTSGYHGVDALRDMMTSECFDRSRIYSVFPQEESDSSGKNYRRLENLITAAGQLKIGTDIDENKEKIQKYTDLIETESEQNEKILPALTYLSEEMGKGLSHILETFAYIRQDQSGRLDRAAIRVIRDELNAYHEYSDNDPDEVIEELLKRSVASENRRKGELHITGIKAGISVLRENLFIAGLSANLFPGNPRENYLMLDNDYLLIAEDQDAPTSDHEIIQKKEQLNDFLNCASALGSTIHLSYSYYDLTNLKEQNPSSALYEIRGKSSGEKEFDHTGYFDSTLSVSRFVGKAYNEGKETFAESDELLIRPHPVDPLRESGFSPTSIETYFKCPRKFFLKYVERILEPEEENPFTLIEPKEFGNMAHKLMEALAEKPETERTEFLQIAESMIDEYFLRRPPLDPEEIPHGKEEFLTTMSRAYDQEREIGNEPVFWEETLEVEHPLGLRLKGRIDRLEKRPDGKYTVVDFKTGGWIDHKDNDSDTCLQALLYAAMVRQEMDLEADRCEYRYLRFKETIHCDYTKLEGEVEEKLMQFKEGLIDGQFPWTEKTDKDCRYCRYKMICGVNGGPDDE